MGISGAMVPEKTCTSRLCTHEHTKNVIAPTLRETVIYTFQTAVCRCLSNASLLPLTQETLLCVGFFCWHFASFCTIAYTSLFFYRLSPLRKFVFNLSCSGCHYYTHIYITIYKKTVGEKDRKSTSFFFTRSLK